MKIIYWKNLYFLGYENYWISSDGRVYSCNNNAIKRYTMLDGYRRLGLSKNNVEKKYLIHRLVALAFIENPKPNEYKIVDHIDRNRENNNIENLRWVNDEINVNNVSEESKLNKIKVLKEIKSKKVYQYSKDGKLIKEWNSTMDAERNGFNHTCISQCCSGIKKTHKGYIWSFTLLENIDYQRSCNEKIKIYQYTLDGELVKIWDSSRSAEREGYNHTAILNCCKGKEKYKTHKGYKWSYVN